VQLQTLVPVVAVAVVADLALQRLAEMDLQD
jgi:hypothetical protein